MENMENVENRVASLMEEMVSEDAVIESNLARTKGFVAGALVIGLTWGAVSLFKKHKKKKLMEIEDVIEHEIKKSKEVKEEIED